MDIPSNSVKNIVITIKGCGFNSHAEDSCDQTVWLDHEEEVQILLSPREFLRRFSDNKYID